MRKFPKMKKIFLGPPPCQILGTPLVLYTFDVSLHKLYSRVAFAFGNSWCHSIFVGDGKQNEVHVCNDDNNNNNNNNINNNNDDDNNKNNNNNNCNINNKYSNNNI